MEMIPSSESVFLRRLLPALCWLAFAFVFVKYALIASFAFPGADFPKHYRAAVEIAHGRDPIGGGNYLGFNYPICTALIYVFLAAFSRPHAELVWDGCNALYVAMSLFLIIRFYRPAPPEGASSCGWRGWAARHWPSVSALLLAIFAPVFLEIADGNIEPLNLFLLVALGAALSRDRQTLAGAVMAMLCVVKILPVLFIVVFALAGKKRLVAVWAIAMGAYAALLLATGWWRWEWFLFTQTLPNVGYNYRELSSSLASIVGRLWFPSIMSSKHSYDLIVKAIATGVMAVNLAALAVGWRIWRAEPRSWRDGVSLLSLSIILMTPLLEYQHYIWGILAYLWLFTDYIEGRMSRPFFLWAVALWLAIFAARYWQDNRIPFPIPHLYAATLFLLVLWLSTAARIVCKQENRQ